MARSVFRFSGERFIVFHDVVQNRDLSRVEVLLCINVRKRTVVVAQHVRWFAKLVAGHDHFGEHLDVGVLGREVGPMSCLKPSSTSRSEKWAKETGCSDSAGMLVMVVAMTSHLPCGLEDRE